MENRIGAELVGQLCQLADGHDRTHLVVYHHNGDQDGVLTQGSLQRVGGDASLGIGLEVSDLIAPGFQLLHAIEDGMMLDGSGDDVLVLFSVAFYGAEDGPVIGLGAAGGEKHPIRFRAHGGSYLLPGGAQCPGGIDAEGVQGTGVAPVFCKGQGHGFHGLGTGFCGGRII